MQIRLSTVILQIDKLDLLISRPYKYTLFLSNTFINNTRLKLAKKLAKSMEHPAAEILTKVSKRKCVCFNEIM